MRFATTGTPFTGLRHWLQNIAIEIPLRSRIRSWLLLLVAGSVSLFSALGIVLVGVVSWFATPSIGRRILAFDNDDPRLEYRLGLALTEIEPTEAVRHLRQATELVPSSQRYWFRLAATCDSVDDKRCADQAWQLLARLGPMVPLYRWHAGQSYLRANRLSEAIVQFRALLDLDPRYASQIWFALLSVQSPDVIFREMLTEHTAPYIKVGFVDFLSRQGDNNDAYRAWRLLALDSALFPFASVKAYLDRLITLDRVDEAESVWFDLERLGVVRRPKMQKSDNLIFNGDFENVPLNGGFDWQWTDKMNYMSIDFSAPAAYHGSHCLRVDFAVNRNDVYEPVYQIVPVFPNRAYRLEGYVRSEDITSDTGPSLRVRDSQLSDSLDILSDTTIGTTTWHAVRVYFSTGSDTQTVRLSVWRPRGRTFPTEISGTFWLDTVSLKDLGPANKGNVADAQH